MFDHFNLLAPFYERLIPAPDTGRLEELLDLPISGRLLDAGGGTGRVSSLLRPYVDEVILPVDTRSKLITAFDMLKNKVDTLPKKKHGNIPL